MSQNPFQCFGIVIGLAGVLSATTVSTVPQHIPGAGHGGHVSGQTAAGHDAHQTPEGWKFTWPKGNAAKGREIFIKLECYSCHEVRGETFPAPSQPVGPELSVMGPLHDAEYFAEAIIHPDAVVEKGKGYEAADGTSKMPSYNDDVTVQEVIDLVAYLMGLRPPADSPAGHSPGGHAPGGHGRH